MTFDDPDAISAPKEVSPEIEPDDSEEQAPEPTAEPIEDQPITVRDADVDSE